MGTSVDIPDAEVQVAIPDEEVETKPSARIPTEKEALAKPPVAPFSASGVLSRPAMPGVSSRFAGPQSVALTPEARSSREIPFDVAKVAAPAVLTAVAPEALLPGAVAGAIGRGAGALTGAHYGGRMATEVGLPRWAGQVVGGATGFLAPEVLGKLSGPIISRIATVLGKSAPEVATVIAEDSTLADKVGRDVVERAARGAPLTEKEEQLLLQQVQKHYTPEAGVETSAQKAGKVYAGRGTNLRPTNEQLALAKRTGLAPPPETGPVAYRARPVGEQGIPASARPQATVDPAEAAEYAKHLTDAKGNPVEGEVVKIDLNKTPHTRVKGPRGSDWIKFHKAHDEDVIF